MYLNNARYVYDVVDWFFFGHICMPLSNKHTPGASPGSSRRARFYRRGLVLSMTVGQHPRMTMWHFGVLQSRRLSLIGSKVEANTSCRAPLKVMSNCLFQNC